MDGLSVATAVLALTTTSRSVYSSVKHFKDIPSRVRRFITVLLHFDNELDVFVRHLSQQLDREYIFVLICDAHDDLVKLDAKLRKATRHTDDGMRARRMSWLLYESGCKELESSLVKTFEKLNTLRQALLIDVILQLPSPQGQLTLEYGSAEQRLVAQTETMRERLSGNSTISTDWQGFRAITESKASRMLRCNCQNFRCQACLSKSFLSRLLAKSRPQHTLMLRGTLPETSEAIRYTIAGNISGLKRVIEAGVINLSMTTDTGWSLLHNAAYHGQFGMVKFLLGQGHHTDFKEDGGRRAADLARVRALRLNATQTEQDIAIMLPDVELFMQDHELTAVHVAALDLHGCKDPSPALSDLLSFIDDVENHTATQSKRFGEVVRYYSKPQTKRFIDVPDAMHGWTPFLWATVTGRLNAMKLLIRSDADPFSISEKGRNAVHLAAESKSADVLSYVLGISDSNGQALDINLADFWKETPLHIAAAVSVEGTRMLLDHGADRAARQADDQVPLHYACMADDKVATVDMLSADSGLHINAQDSEGRTPIFSLLDSAACVSLLMRRGADVTVKDYEGNAVAERAVLNDAAGSLKVLLQGDALSADASNLVLLAMTNRCSACAQLLLQDYELAGFEGTGGWSLVHYAAAWGDEVVLEAVLKHSTFRRGARTSKDESAADIAKEARKWTGRVKELLREYDSSLQPVSEMR